MVWQGGVAYTSLVSFIDTLNRLLGDPNEKELRAIRRLVPAIREWEKSDAFQNLTLDVIPRKTQEFRDRIAAGTELDDLLPEAFALVCRTCALIQGKTVLVGAQEFVWDMVPFDVQLVGGVVLHRGAIAEMKTGEGKTLVCTMPVYLNALMEKGVHVVTVNDYLARRDAAWMGMLYEALGLTIGTVRHGMGTNERQAAYGCDVTYGTNNEFGFDYLRDNMAPALEHQVQQGANPLKPKGLTYAIVDEVDSILVDEARTPLIISQPADESTEKYVRYASLVRELRENRDFNKDEKQRAVTLTEEGVKKMESLLGVENIYTERGFQEVHHIEQALRAHGIYQRDTDYVIKDGEVIIVDEFTGRLMPGRRFGHGLHQAIEAKEGVPVQRESKTLATITFQNYFRLYKKLAGMTGTAKTEEEEFESIYRLRVVVIPTHKTCVRSDKPDAVYRTVAAKFAAAARIAKEKHAKGQPVLIGTTSIEKSEAMSALLTKEEIPHQVLNAKHHEQEAEIVAKAGTRGAVTIATNMAGRGTDIKLGSEVAELGGLCVLGTERHEARRIDNQLRGRSGRQGDLGESQFFVSMEDELMRLFGGDRLKSMMERLQVPDDVPLENRIVSRSIESAQKKVEGRNFDLRRHVLQYDNVMNKHREIIYRRRQNILEKIGHVGDSDGEDHPLHDNIERAMAKEMQILVGIHGRDIDPEKWNIQEMEEHMHALHPDLGKKCTREYIQSFDDPDRLTDMLREAVRCFYRDKCMTYPKEIVNRAEELITLRAIDTHWMSHIDDMAHLREQVAFAGFAQRDPLIEYQDQGFRRFEQLLAATDGTVVRALLQVDFGQFMTHAFTDRTEDEVKNVETNEGEIEAGLTAKIPRPTAAGKANSNRKVGRNDPCPCGSGKKHKKCHGL